MLTDAFEPVVLEVNNGPEVRAHDPDKHPMNEAVHTELLRELLPVVAMPRTTAPVDSMAMFVRLMKRHLLGSHVPNETRPLALCPGTRLVVDYPASHVDAGSTHAQDTTTARCLNHADVATLWEAFDETRRTIRLERVFPSGCEGRYANLYLTPEPWLARVTRHWLTIVDGCWPSDVP